MRKDRVYGLCATESNEVHFFEMNEYKDSKGEDGWSTEISVYEHMSDDCLLQFDIPIRYRRMCGMFRDLWSSCSEELVEKGQFPDILCLPKIRPRRKPDIY